MYISIFLVFLNLYFINKVVYHFLLFAYAILYRINKVIFWIHTNNIFAWRSEMRVLVTVIEDFLAKSLGLSQKLK